MNEIERKIDSAEYQCLLDETLSTIMNQLKDSTNEASTASRFENNLHFLVKSYFNKDIVFDKEVGQGFFRHKFHGRTDAIVNELIIEYKFHTKLSTVKHKNEAINQLKDYLNQIYNETGVQKQAFLTDGYKVSYFYFYDNQICNTAFRPFDTRDLDHIIKSLLNVGLKQFDPRNIVNDFKLNSSSSLTANLVNSLFAAICSNRTVKTNMLFQEWQTLFRLSENDKGQNQDIKKRRKALSDIFSTPIDDNEKEYLSLYVLQTSFAIIVKLIAAKVLTKIKFNDELKYFSDLSKIDSSQLQIFSQKMEDGYVFSVSGIRNLLEGDFFSWYSDFYQWDNEISKSIKAIITELDNYASASFTLEFSTIDIFKDLYIEIMPNEVRHSLGEYFTPAWLADQVVSKSINMISEKKWRAIDPCCGSGVFVITLIKKILSKYEISYLSTQEKSEILQEVLGRVYGIDLNPMSVLTARVSYLLAIRPLLDEQKFEIPIYLGDSANIPQRITLGGTDCYSYKIGTKQGEFDITLPVNFVKSISFFEKMYILQTTIKAANSNLLFTQFEEYIKDNDENNELKESLKSLSDNLVKLHENNWDGIWIRIATNFMLIAKIEEMDIIVGNPPWIKWEFLPQMYAEKIKSLCVDKKLFSGQRYMGAISLNLCALIANVTATQWLKKGGVLSFLMPKTIMTQDSFEGFRKFFISDSERMYLQEVDDWSKAGNPFIVTQEKFMTYFFKHDFLDYSLGVKTNFFSKKKNTKIMDINHLHSFGTVQNKFDVKKGLSYTIASNRSGFTIVPTEDFELLRKIQAITGENKCDYKARSGVEFTPAEVYFLTPVKKAKNPKNWVFKANQFSSSIYKTSYQTEFELETQYIRPVVKSPNIQYFKIENSDSYCIFPYDNGNRFSVPINSLVGSNDLLLRYLSDNKELISKQSARSLDISMGNDFYALSKVGNYTYAPHKVVFRDNTNMCAAVVHNVKTPWGSIIAPICAKHAPYISMDKENNPISEDEAYYISGILNTEIVNQYFKFTYSERSYSINFSIKIPKFDKNNIDHVMISQTAREAEKTSSDDEIQRLRKKLDELYLKVCGYVKDLKI